MANASGTATITVLVTDNGGTANGGVNTTTQTFTVTVLRVNQPPALTATNNPAAILENAGPQAITLAGITSGLGDPTQNLTITAVSSNPNLIPNSGPGAVALSYTSPGAGAVLTYTPLPFTSGTAAIVVTVMDDGGAANGGFNLVSRSFIVVVTPVNQQPTLAAIPNQGPFNENTLTAQSPGTITLTGISTGQGDVGQLLTITAVSNNPGLIPNPSISYTNGTSTATLTYIPTFDVSGSAVITVTAVDNGGVANGGVNSISQQFTVTILPVNQPPTINLVPTPAPINENTTAVQTINLTGITAGRGNSGETVTITATSDNPALIPNPTPLPATATATLSSAGAVNAIQVTNGGSDYAFPPVVTLTGANFVTPATATAVVSGGVVTAILVTGGSGYTSVPSRLDRPADRHRNRHGGTHRQHGGLVHDHQRRRRLYQPADGLPQRRRLHHPGDCDRRGDQWRGHRDQLHRRRGLYLGAPGHDRQPRDRVAGGQLHLPEHDGHAELHGAAGYLRHGQYHPHRDEQRQRHQYLLANLPDHGRARQPGARSLTDPQLAHPPGRRHRDRHGDDQRRHGQRDHGHVRRRRLREPARGHIHRRRHRRHPPGGDRHGPQRLGHRDHRHRRVGLHLGAAGHDRQPDCPRAGGSPRGHRCRPGRPPVQPRPADGDGQGNRQRRRGQQHHGHQQRCRLHQRTHGHAHGRRLGREVRTRNGHRRAEQQRPGHRDPDHQSGAGYTTAPAVTISSQPQGQFLRVTATSNNTNLIASERVVYTNPSTTGTLFYDLKPGASGVAVITVSVTDDGGTARGGRNTTLQSFTVTVEPLNHAPTINVVNPISLIENSPQQTVKLAGITDGIGDIGQGLSVTATSSNTSLIPNPVVNYTSPNSTGTFTYTPVPGNTGTATITLVVMDTGGTANGGVNTFTESFVITVIPINHSPTLDPINTPATIFENAPAQTIGLTGISDGDNMTQFAVVTAVSSNPQLIQNPTVSYTNPSTTGSLTYTPAANTSGTAKITVTVTDNGGTANGGINTFSQTFTVTVTAVNQPPTITAIAPITILENSGTQTLNLAGIGRGPGDPASQVVTITASSSNPTLIPVPAITYTNPSMTGSLTYAPTPFGSGSSLITLTLTDTGGTANGGQNTTIETFTVVVLPVNQQPTLDLITSPAPILENAGQQVVNLTGISDGIGDLGQTVTVNAISSNPGLINPTVTITHPTGSTDSIIYTPTANMTGTATISVIVSDDGGTSNGGHNTFIGTFTVVVTGVNAPPTITPIPSQPGVLENGGPQTINLFGISDGLGDVGQTVKITATSSNPSLIPNPSITYTNPNTTGTLTFTPVAYGIGTAKITVTLMDNGGTANNGIDTTVTSFNVTVNAVNQPPQLTAIPNQGPILENAPGVQTVSLAGITDGIGDTGQSLTVTATTNKTSLITNPTVVYTSPANTGTLSYSVQPNASGTGTITVTVTDNGPTGGANVNTFSQTFTVTVTPVNQPPTLGAITSPQPILENSGQQTITFGPGPGASGDHRRRRRQRTELDCHGDRHDDDRHVGAQRPLGHLHQPQHQRLAHLHADGQHLRHGDDYRHGDRQRRHRQRRYQHGQSELPGAGHAGQPGAHARPDREPGPAGQPRSADHQPHRHQRRDRRPGADRDRLRREQQHRGDRQPDHGQLFQPQLHRHAGLHAGGGRQ